MIKTLLLAGAAVGAMAFAAEAADYKPIAAPVTTSPVSMDIALYTGFFSNRWHSDDDKIGNFSENGWIIGGLARANLWLAPGMSVQLDVFGENLNFNDFTSTVFDIAGHLSMRGPGYLLGAFGSLGAAGGSGAGTLGLEAQSYFGPFLLYAQAGYATAFNRGDISAWFVHGEGRYFVTNNFVVSANVGLAKLDFTGCCPTPLDSTAIRWGVEAETRLSKAFGAFAAYRGARASGTDEQDYDWSSTSHALLVGIKLYSNTTDLLQQAQKAETLRNFSPLTGVNSLNGLNWGMNPYFIF